MTDSAHSRATVSGTSFDGNDAPALERISDCIHCGFCLPACPTYRVLGNEMDSPRGRLYLMKAAHEGKVDITARSVVDHMYVCLLCRACETACPSKVQFGPLMEATRGQIARRYRWPLGKRLLRRFLFFVFPYPRRVAWLLWLARWYERLGLKRLVGALRILPRLSKSVAAMEALLPPLREVPRLPRPAAVTPARGRQRFRVGVLLGCVQRELFPQVNRATIEVLTRRGCEVVVPANQGCCGSLQAHEGEREQAKAFARRTIDTFAGEPLDYVIVNAAGCGSLMKEYDELLQNDSAYAERASGFAAKVRDAIEFVAEIGAGDGAPLGPVPLVATYHDACHLVHGQKISRQPREVLARVPGLALVPLPESDVCCGSAGVYNLLEPGPAEAFLQRKLDNIEATGAAAIITANPGCTLQIAKGLRQRGHPMPVYHPLEILEMAYAGEQERIA